MLIFTRLLGLALMLGGISGLANQIRITTSGYMINAPAVFLCALGVLMLVYGGESIQNWAWGIIAFGIILTLAKGGIVIVSTTLMTFLICFLAMACGYKLLTRGKL
ncbi:MAG: hypothetical protein AAF208_09310 [Cyanobacteria bacterium P01_A01_bin.45]